MEILIWAGKASLYWVFFYGCFYFFLSKLTHFRWNRLYLLAGLILPLLIPFVQVPESATETLVLYSGQLDAINIRPAEKAGTAFPWLTWLAIVYLAGVAFMAFRLVRKLFVLNKLWSSTAPVELENNHVSLYLFPDDKIKSFSFLNKIGISRSDYQDHFDKILSHEMIHVRQFHSFDILLTEVLRIFFWFHPVLPLYKKAFQEIHEFLADQQTPDRDAYAEFLIAYTFDQPQLTLVHNFYNASLLKQRITMLYKNKSPKWKFSLYGVTAVFGLALIVAVAACTDNAKMEDSAEIKILSPHVDSPMDATDKVFTAVEQNPEFTGGVPEMYKYLASNIKYPDAARKAGVEGRVFLQFIVKTDGSIADVVVIKGIGFGCDTEAVRVVKNMPTWNPGKQSGVPVNVKYMLPVNFELPGSKPSVSVTEVTDALNPEEKPLYIVDGKEISSFKEIDPETIESISVLKGAKSKEAYGEKGKNGVVEIKIKKR